MCAAALADDSAGFDCVRLRRGRLGRIVPYERCDEWRSFSLVQCGQNLSDLWPFDPLKAKWIGYTTPVAKRLRNLRPRNTCAFHARLAEHSQKVRVFPFGDTEVFIPVETKTSGYCCITHDGI